MQPKEQKQKPKIQKQIDTVYSQETDGS